MKSYVYPTFIISPEDFEEAKEIAVHLSSYLNLPCRYWEGESSCLIGFKDKAVTGGIVYSPKHEKQLWERLADNFVCEIIYQKEDSFNTGQPLITA